ncbi:hypothetical protein [Anaeromicropila herbilytica]|uniref:DUF5673 domain-containing protein n=1 Tax=Anaeromicropila herbilytica TaxID=2785025 RepID=A0A7R7EKS0_9FIRM|nr:hypothetical protein [Anaeromicropila herbilytica]BCN30579.1 hypothetical protein bsdtb5_18740 [Anaeromicropila herbilytica]
MVETIFNIVFASIITIYVVYLLLLLFKFINYKNKANKKIIRISPKSNIIVIYLLMGVSILNVFDLVETHHMYILYTIGLMVICMVELLSRCYLLFEENLVHIGFKKYNICDLYLKGYQDKGNYVILFYQRIDSNRPIKIVASQETSKVLEEEKQKYKTIRYY